MEKIKIVNWPKSQYCMDCGYGHFIDGAALKDSTFQCTHPDKEKQDEECYSGKFNTLLDKDEDEDEDIKDNDDYDDFSNAGSIVNSMIY